MKFAVTGGHHNSALVIARKLRDKNHKIVWLGHKYASHSDLNESAEYTEVTASGIPFYELKAGKLTSYNKIANIIRIPIGLYQSIKILKQEKPDAIISFGSYLGANVSVAAWLLRIPVYLHEQTVVAGKANLFASRFARTVFISWESSAKYYKKSKVVFTGLPLRKSILTPKKQKLFPNTKKTLLILGGKQGSHVINTAIFNILENLLSRYNIIHQTGTSSVTGDYERAIAMKEALSPKLASSYQPEGYITEDEIGKYIFNSDLIISRSGAHIIYELALLNKLCILIPFEHTHKKEQLINARVLKQAGQAIIIRQKDLNSNKLSKHISQVLKQKSKHSSIQLPKNADSTMLNHILNDLA